mgnify:CR=1 FL=1
MSEVPLISTEKQAELLQRSDISKISLRNGEKGGCEIDDRKFFISRSAQQLHYSADTASPQILSGWLFLFLQPFFSVRLLS